MLVDDVREVMTRYQLLDRSDHVVVAVSGGMDSMVLLHVLCALTDAFDLHLTVAHLNHGWRGAESDADEDFVSKAAASLGLPFISEGWDKASAEAHRGAGREGVARAVRREFLRRTAERVGAQRIATGHTSNDRAETILYDLTRGAGLSGLAGISPANGPFVRPLITVSRDQVASFAEAEGISWRVDDTNRDLSFARNRIRHNVLPELQQINGHVIEAVCRAGDHAANARVAEKLLVEMLWPKVVCFEEPDEIQLHRSALTTLPSPVQSLLLRDALRRLRGDVIGLDAAHIETVVKAAMACHGHADHHLPGAFIRADRARISLSTAPFGETDAWEIPVEIGRTDCPTCDISFHLEFADRHARPVSAYRHDPTTEVADADAIRLPLRARSRRPGDRFTPLGMSHPMKLKTFLINERVPFFSRNDLPLLCDRDRIIWVVGVRLSDDVRVRPSTRRVLVMRMESVP